MCLKFGSFSSRNMSSRAREILGANVLHEDERNAFVTVITRLKVAAERTDNQGALRKTSNVMWRVKHPPIWHHGHASIPLSSAVPLVISSSKRSRSARISSGVRVSTSSWTISL